MSEAPRVFLDTSVRKHAIRKRTTLRPRGNGAYELSELDPAADVQPELKREIDLLTQVATVARKGMIKLLSHIEATSEFFSILLLPGPGESVFAGLEIELVNGPFEYSRLASPMPPFITGSAKDIQIEFVAKIHDARFLEIRSACGADQGPGVAAPRNQLLDAFHLWCAESADATHFLTTDLKLTRVVRTYRKAPLKLKVVAPSELLADLGVLV
jgi:hypothetical protein